MAAAARRLIIPFLIAASFARMALAQVPGRDPIGAARDLYASARYDEALAVLNDLRPSEAGGSVSDRKSIEQYRSLCLLALGRGTEAETAIAAVVTADPTYLPGEAEASPRVRAAFSDVRKRLLPEIAATRYAEAKSAYDRKDYAGAIPQFRRVLTLLDDPDMAGKGTDLRTLTSGFLDLAVAASAPPEPPKPAPARSLSAAAPVPPAPRRDPNRIFTIADANVVAPAALRQDMPRLAPAMLSQAKERGVVEVIIDEQGRVAQVFMRESVHPMYDALVLSAARDWRYRPATLDGAAVKYRKMIQINVSKQQ